MKADDDFAKSMGMEGIDQLRELMKGQIEQELNGLSRTHMKRQLLDQLAAAHDFLVPESMVDAEFQQIWQQLEHEASHEEDPKAALAEMEKEKDDYRAIAERRVRLGLLLSEIGNKNGILITEQEMNQLLMQAAQQYKPEDRRASSNMSATSRWPPPSCARPCSRTRSSTSCSARPTSASARRAARTSRPRSSPRTAMSMGRAAATITTMITSRRRRRREEGRRQGREGRGRGREAGEEGRGQS